MAIENLFGVSSFSKTTSTQVECKIENEGYSLRGVGIHLGGKNDNGIEIYQPFIGSVICKC